MDITITVTIISVAGVIFSALCSIIASSITVRVQTKNEIKIKAIDLTLRKIEVLNKFHSAFGAFFAKPTYGTLQDAGRSVGGVMVFASDSLNSKLQKLILLSTNPNYIYDSVLNLYNECSLALNKEMNIQELTKLLK